MSDLRECVEGEPSDGDTAPLALRYGPPRGS